MNSPDAQPGYTAMYDDGFDWRNEIGARSALQVVMSSPGRKARDVRCPALVQVALDDVITPPAPALEAAGRMPQGELVTSSGYSVQPGITIPDGAQSVTIGADGVVTVQLAGQSAPTQVGSLQLVDFINPAGLQPRGENLLLESAASGPAQSGTPGLNGLGLLVQGSVESSNVNVVEELVSMIETQRAYEMNSKAIATTDQMLEYVTNQL